MKKPLEQNKICKWGQEKEPSAGAPHTLMYVVRSPTLLRLHTFSFFQTKYKIRESVTFAHGNGHVYSIRLLVCSLLRTEFIYSRDGDAISPNRLRFPYDEWVERVARSIRAVIHEYFGWIESVLLITNSFVGFFLFSCGWYSWLSESFREENVTISANTSIPCRDSKNNENNKSNCGQCWKKLQFLCVLLHVRLDWTKFTSEHQHFVQCQTKTGWFTSLQPATTDRYSATSVAFCSFTVCNPWYSFRDLIARSCKMSFHMLDKFNLESHLARKLTHLLNMLVCSTLRNWKKMRQKWTNNKTQLEHCSRQYEKRNKWPFRDPGTMWCRDNDEMNVKSLCHTRNCHLHLRTATMNPLPSILWMYTILYIELFYEYWA